MAITIIAVAFLFKAKLDEVQTSSNESTSMSKPLESHDHDHDHEEDHDHTIDAADAPPKTNIIRVGSQGVESEIEKWTLPVFKSYINETYKTLPNLKDARGLKDEEVHQNPKLVMDAGLRLGSIKKQIKLNSDFEEEGMKFYDKCALKKDGLTPVRALCLANLVYMKNQKGEDFELEKYPEKVKDLAQKALELSF
ncbi:MAG: hypothetical protein ACJAT2_001446 [Bacteriovoracaceae bacterium]|jgi:hypothetical protein